MSLLDKQEKYRHVTITWPPPHPPLSETGNRIARTRVSRGLLIRTHDFTKLIWLHILGISNHFKLETGNGYSVVCAVGTPVTLTNTASILKFVLSETCIKCIVTTSV